MSRIAIDEERCKGCLLCTAVCPKAILARSARLNAQGYKVVEALADKADACTGCASCALVCPDVAITVWRSSKTRKEAA